MNGVRKGYYSGREAQSLGFGSVLRLCVATNCACVIMQDQFEPRSEFCFPKQDGGGPRYFITCQLLLIKIKNTENS